MIKAGVIGLGSHFLEHILGSIRETCEIKTTIICDIDTKKIDRAKLYFSDASTTTDWQCQALPFPDTNSRLLRPAA